MGYHGNILLKTDGGEGGESGGRRRGRDRQPNLVGM